MACAAEVEKTFGIEHGDDFVEDFLGHSEDQWLLDHWSLVGQRHGCAPVRGQGDVVTGHVSARSDSRVWNEHQFFLDKSGTDAATVESPAMELLEDQMLLDC